MTQDEYRLPEGVKRVGYDSDSGCYYFRDQAGRLYKGSEGAEYGEMTSEHSVQLHPTIELRKTDSGFEQFPMHQFQ